HARTDFAEVRRSRIETLTGTGVGFAGGVAILEDGIGRQVPIGDRRGTERIGSVAQKLNVLRFAAKLKIEKPSEYDIATASRAPRCGTASGVEKRRTIKAIVGFQPSLPGRLYDARI